MKYPPKHSCFFVFLHQIVITSRPMGSPLAFIGTAAVEFSEIVLVEEIK